MNAVIRITWNIFAFIPAAIVTYKGINEEPKAVSEEITSTSSSGNNIYPRNTAYAALTYKVVKMAILITFDDLIASIMLLRFRTDNYCQYNCGGAHPEKGDENDISQISL
jgi:hypothetical protein